MVNNVKVWYVTDKMADDNRMFPLRNQQVKITKSKFAQLERR